MGKIGSTKPRLRTFWPGFFSWFMFTLQVSESDKEASRTLQWLRKPLSQVHTHQADRSKIFVSFNGSQILRAWQIIMSTEDIINGTVPDCLFYWTDISPSNSLNSFTTDYTNAHVVINVLFFGKSYVSMRVLSLIAFRCEFSLCRCK